MLSTIDVRLSLDCLRTILLSTPPEVDLLDHVIILFSLLRATAIKFDSSRTSLLTHQPWTGFQFLHIFANMHYFLFFFLFDNSPRIVSEVVSP